MFQRERVIAALEAKADRFAGYEAALSDALAAYEQALAELEGLSKARSRGTIGGHPLARRPADRRAGPVSGHRRAL